MIVKWEHIEYDNTPEAIYFQDKLFRTKVPGGWLVKCVSPATTYKSMGGYGPSSATDRTMDWESTSSITFVPDPTYIWGHDYVNLKLKTVNELMQFPEPPTKENDNAGTEIEFPQQP